MQRWELALCPLLAPVPELPTCRRASHPTSACYSVHPTSVILPQHHVKGQRTAHPDPSASGPQRWTHMPPGVHVTGWPVGLIPRLQEALLAHPHAHDEILAVVTFATCWWQEERMWGEGNVFPVRF